MSQLGTTSLALVCELAGLEEGCDGVFALVTLHGLFLAVGRLP